MFRVVPTTAGVINLDQHAPRCPIYTKTPTGHNETCPSSAAAPCPQQWPHLLNTEQENRGLTLKNRVDAKVASWESDVLVCR